MIPSRVSFREVRHKGAENQGKVVGATGRSPALRLDGDRTVAPTSRPQPGLRRLVLRLEGIDGGGLLQRQADVVEAVEEAVLAEGVEVECDAAAVGAADLL